MLVCDNTIKGRVGFNINVDDIKTLALKLVKVAYSLYAENAALLCNSSGSEWATIFKDVLISETKSLITTYINDKSCSYYEHLWLAQEIKLHSCLCIYITDTPEGYTFINIKLNKHNLHPLSTDYLLEDFNTFYTNSINELEVLNIDNYSQYLIDKKLINIKNLENINLNIDCMFGSSEHFFNSFANSYPGSIRLFNRQNQPIRLLNYTCIPSGQFLKNYATTALQEDYNHLFFGLSSDCTQIGGYDLKQNVEINPSSLVLLLAYYYAKIEKRKGSVILTSITSTKVLEILNNFKLSYEIIDCGETAFYNAVYKKRKRPLLFYANEYGCIYFKNDIPAPNPYLTIFKIGELCKNMQRSPGEIIDIITNTFLKTTYYNIIISYFTSYVTLDILKESLSPYALDYKEYKYSLIYSLTNNIRLAIKINLSYNRYELYFESPDKIELRKLTDIIQENIKNKCQK